MASSLTFGGQQDTLGADGLGGCHLVFAASQSAAVLAHVPCKYNDISPWLEEFEKKCKALHDSKDGDLLPKGSTYIYLLHGEVSEELGKAVNEDRKPQCAEIRSRVTAMQLSEHEPMTFWYHFDRVYLNQKGRFEEVKLIEEEPRHGTAFVYVKGTDEPEFYVEDEFVAEGPNQKISH
ncbi:MAG: hypothetical protein Q9162_004213 [Coniocarpon cinnabarinum]